MKSARLPGQGVAEDPLAEGGLGDARTEEVRCTSDGDADPSALLRRRAVLRSSQPVFGLWTVVAASGKSSVIGLPPVGP